MGGIRGTAIEAGAGALSYYGAMALSQRVTFFQRWYATPLALAVVGYLLKKKPRLAGVGAAICGVAGYQAAMGYSVARQAPQLAAAPAATEGVGMLYGYGDAGMLMGGAELPYDTSPDLGAGATIGRRNRAA